MRKNGRTKNGVRATHNSKLQMPFMYAKEQFIAVLKINREYVRSSNMMAIQHERPIQIKEVIKWHQDVSRRYIIR